MPTQIFPYPAVKPGGRFRAILTRPIAIALLANTDMRRAINAVYPIAFAFEFLGGTYEADKASIIVDHENKKLIDGVNRLVGFLLSGLEEYEMMFELSSEKAFIFHDSGLSSQPPYPHR